MQELIKTIAEKAGISESIAQVAVDTVITHLKDKLPDGIGDQLSNFLSDNPQDGEDSSNLLGGLTDKLGGLFGK